MEALACGEARVRTAFLQIPDKIVMYILSKIKDNHIQKTLLIS